jgi:uncharacterized metal-binding protein
MKTGIIGCSGASNTGAYSDLAARKLAKTGRVKMLCLARFTVDEKFTEQMKNEISEYIVLDGCPINCAEVIMKNAGIDKFVHINTTDYGIIKGKTPVSEEKIDEISESILTILNKT